MNVNPNVDGRELSRFYYEHVVGPLITSRWPTLPHAAGRLGQGSDVLGIDDGMSRDHDWGLRVSLFVEAVMVDQVRAFLDDALPETFNGLPTRFAFSGESKAVHHVDVTTVSDFAMSRLGCNPMLGMSVVAWLSLTGQSVLEVIAGPVFVDQTGELSAVRNQLEWYPDDIWRYIVESAWLRVDEELPVMSRAGHRGDDLGARLIAARLVDVVVHLAFLLECRWSPYSKWRGTLFGELRCAADLRPLLTAVLNTSDWRIRQETLGLALDRLLAAQTAAGLPAPTPAIVPFWDRPYLQVNDRISASLRESIHDPRIRSLPSGRGCVEQRTNNVAILVDPEARRALVSHD